MTVRVLSVGYEGSTIDGFVEQLLQNRVEVVVDVRLNAVSRRPGFSKTKLAARLASEGVQYVHEPTLGNPPENRAGFSNGELETARSNMTTYLEQSGQEALARIVELVAQRRNVAVMCVERSHTGCHRSVIIEALEEVIPDLDVTVAR